MIDLQNLPKTSGIYCIENTVNGKKYVGQSQNIKKRLIKGHVYHLRCGSHINNHLQAAWDKYGEDSFKIYVLEECPCDNLDSREMFYIDLLATRTSGYNQTEGGGGRRGYTLPDETRHKLSISNTGKKHSDETKKLLSDIHTGLLTGANHPGSVAVRCTTTGMTFVSIRDAAKYYNCISGSISRCLLGKQVTAGRDPASGQKLRWEAMDKCSTQRECLYRPVNMREVICINNGLHFDSIVSAAQYCNGQPNNIGAAAKGTRASAGKDPITGERLRWQYAEEVVAC